MGDRLSTEELERLVKIMSDNPSDLALLLIALNEAVSNWSVEKCMAFRDTGDWGLLGGSIGAIQDAFDISDDDIDAEMDVDNGEASDED